MLNKNRAGNPGFYSWRKQGFAGANPTDGQYIKLGINVICRLLSFHLLTNQIKNCFLGNQNRSKILKAVEMVDNVVPARLCVEKILFKNSKKKAKSKRQFNLKMLWLALFIFFALITIYQFKQHINSAWQAANI